MISMCFFYIKFEWCARIQSSESKLPVALKLGIVPLFYPTTAVIVYEVYVCFVYSIAATTEPSFMNRYQ